MRPVRATPVAFLTASGSPIMVPLRCIIGGAGLIKSRGPVTGTKYEFRPGKVTLVDLRDKEGLLAKRTSPKQCCGGQSPPQPQPLYTEA